MRERHIARLCHSCQAPMAGQADTCWRCGTEWASEDALRPRLRVIPGGIEMDRWVDEGGSVPVEAAALLSATTNRR
jgi:ribosomal protein L40E